MTMKSVMLQLREEQLAQPHAHVPKELASRGALSCESVATFFAPDPRTIRR